jgi:hypothetical protein
MQAVGFGRHCVPRLMMFATATGDQGVPRALGTPRAVRARATPRSVVMPLACNVPDDRERVRGKLICLSPVRCNPERGILRELGDRRASCRAPWGAASTCLVRALI